MSREVTQKQIDEAREVIHKFVPLIVRVGIDLVHAVSARQTEHPALENSLLALTKAIVESDKF